MSNIRKDWAKERPGYQFYQVNDEAIKTLRPIITAKDFTPAPIRAYIFSSDPSQDELIKQFKKIKELFYRLVNANALLYKIMDNEELERKDAEVDSELDEKVQAAEQNESSLREQLMQLELGYQQEKEALVQHGYAVTDAIGRETTDAKLDVMKQIAADSTIAADIVRTQRDLQNKETALATKCCFQFFCCYTKEKIEIKSLENTLQTLEHQEDHTKKPSAEQIKQKEEIQSLKADTKKTRQELEALPRSYLHNKFLLGNELGKASLQVAQAKAKRDNQVEDCLAEISSKNILFYVRAYACLIELEKATASAITEAKILSQPVRAKNKVSPETSLVALDQALSDSEKKHKDLLGKLWVTSPPTRKSGMEIYQQFLSLVTHTKQSFLDGKLTLEEFTQQQAVDNTLTPAQTSAAPSTAQIQAYRR